MRSLREALVLALVALIPGAFAIALHPQLADRARAGLESDAVRVADVREWKMEVLWIDARSEEEFSRAHVPGAVHLDEAHFNETLGDVLAQWTPDRRLVVYCSSTGCSTSKAVAKRLRDAGLTDVYYLHGGWEAWSAATKS